MKKLLLLFLLAGIGNPVLAQSVLSTADQGISKSITENGKWVRKPGYTLHKWNSFMVFEDITEPAASLTGYTIESIMKDAGQIETNDVTTSETQALAIVQRLLDLEAISSRTVSKDVPNIIPYKNGLILYGYVKAKGIWELFNIDATSLTMQMPHLIFGLAKTK